jgi:hydroxymethylbilane synthase
LQSSGKQVLTIGTRGSPLALAQAHQVRALLIRAHGLSGDAIAIVAVSTAGDRTQASNRPLSDFGGKGLFSKEIEDWLVSGRVDLGVHSAKDMATNLPDGLIMPVFLAREDVRDALISPNYEGLDALPKGAVVGTSSLRRRAQLLRARPDLEMVEFRGNLGTRLKKLEAGQADATLLAAAGLNRLGQTDKATAYLDPERFPPAPAQGAIGIEIRAGDTRVADLVAPLNHARTHDAIIAERAMLRVIDGSCRTPVGVLTRRAGDVLTLTGEVLSPDGRECHQATVSGPACDAESLGTGLGDRLLALAGADFIARLKAGA